MFGPFNAVCLQGKEMKSLRSTHHTAHENAIQALKTAIVEGATFDYERLINAAIRAGVSDQELDVVIHDALEMLFYSEEHPVTGGNWLEIGRAHV